MRIQVNARNQSYAFEAAEGEKILFAGLRQGVDLPYECATGTCGSCKAKVIGGEVNDLWPDAPGKNIRGDDRKRLMSVRALTDLDAWLGTKQEAGSRRVVNGR